MFEHLRSDIPAGNATANSGAVLHVATAVIDVDRPCQHWWMVDENLYQSARASFVARGYDTIELTRYSSRAAFTAVKRLF